MKPCPRCAESVQDAARVCRYCGHDFDNTEFRSRPVKPSTFERASLIALVGATLILLGSLSVWVRDYTGPVNGMELDLFHHSMARRWPLSWVAWVPKGLIAFLAGLTVLSLGLLGRLGSTSLEKTTQIEGMFSAAVAAAGIAVWSYIDDVNDGKGDLGFGLVLVMIGGILAGITWYMWNEAAAEEQTSSR